MKPQKGFSAVLVIIIAAVAVMGGGAALLLRDRKIPIANAPDSIPSIVPESLVPAVTATPKPTPAPTPAPKPAPKPTAPKPALAPTPPTPAPQSPHSSYSSYLSANFFRQNPELPSENEKQQLPACGGQTFSFYPVDISKITSITPLGNLNPPGHTFPTEHTYLHITPGGATTDTIPLYSPADVHLLLIAFSRGLTQDPVDYTLYFALCRDVIGYFNHIKEISPEIQKLIADGHCMFPGETKDTQCHIQTLTPVNGGDGVGRVGRLQGNFDFGLIDLRTKLQFANPNRYGTRSFHIRCVYDYYEGAKKEQFYNLLSRKDGSCGVTAQDIPGTLKGNWFFGNARADMGDAWDKYLAFVQDNNNPEKLVISIGGVIEQAGKLEFLSAPSGLINREFAHVTPDGNIYCYEGGTFPGRIILQLINATELKIEHQNSSCATSPVFLNPMIYKR